MKLKPTSLLMALAATAIVVMVSHVAWATSGKQTTGDLLYLARKAAEADEHRKSINFYLSAIKKRPALLRDVSIEIAHQYTWAEIPHLAVYWYEYTLLNDPDNLDAKLGIARALAWDDQLQQSETYYEALLPESGDRRNDVIVGLAKVKSWQEDYEAAEGMYRQVLAEDPDNRDARLGLAEVTSWSGRPREAQLMYEDLLEDDPEDTEALRGLANAQSAAGRPDVALETLESADDAELADESESIDNRGAVNNSNTYFYRDNTTDGEYRALVFEVGLAVANLTHIGVEYTRGRMTQEGRSDIIRDQVMIPISQRFSDALVVNVSPGYQWNGFDPLIVPPSTQSVDEFNLFVWDAYATVVPHDWVRVDVGNSRETLTIPQTVYKHIDLTTTNAGLDWRLNRRVITFWEPSFTAYNDGNGRFAFGQSIQWTPPVRLPYHDRNFIVLSQGLEYMSFKEQLNNGYFNPSSYVQLVAGLRFVTDIGQRLNINVAGAFGAEKEAGLDWTSTGSFEAGLRIKMGKNSYLRTGYVRSGSRLRSADGFRAKGFFITLDFYVPQ
jgi:tetratricopeptide (TPR) repeat protein